MATVHVLAIITAKPGRRAKILEAFQANVPNVHAEDGCIQYVATVDAEGAGDVQTRFGEDTFVVVEKWASLDALKAHAAAPHMAAYAAKTRDLIANRVIRRPEPAFDRPKQGESMAGPRPCCEPPIGTAQKCASHAGSGTDGRTDRSHDQPVPARSRKRERTMADLQRLLGGMLASGMGGRSRRGPAFAASPFLGSRSSGFGSFRKTAGLGALAYLGYKAYQEYKKNNPDATAPGAPGTASPGAGPASREGGPSLGERLGSLLGMGTEPESEPEPAALDDAQAMLLIRAMIAAANADGEITPDERQRITSKLDQAGAGAEERAVLERELQSPRSVDQIVRDVHDQETAEQVYVASRLAMNPDTAAEKAYLDLLAARLEIPADRLDELNAAA